MDETGNVVFAVVGYMNRGRYEGQVGVQVYTYDRMKNTIEEIVFIPYHKGEQILLAEMEKLLYASGEGYLYLCLEDMLYQVDLSTKKYEGIVPILQDDTLQSVLPKNINLKDVIQNHIFFWYQNFKISAEPAYF
jgi:hypothetical protein